MSESIFMAGSQENKDFPFFIIGEPVFYNGVKWLVLGHISDNVVKIQSGDEELRVDKKHLTRKEKPKLKIRNANDSTGRQPNNRKR